MQYFKGDPKELKMIAVGEPVMDLTSAALDEFYEEGFNASPFLLMLYDENRMPFYTRVPRDIFVDFIKEALRIFPFTGTFESYLFILNAIFGIDSEVTFDVPAPGRLNIDVAAIANSEFEFMGREFIPGSGYELFNITDSEGDELLFRGVPGIETEYELNLLFSEIIPDGIVPAISLSFFTRSDWVAEEESILYNVTDNNDNQIVFYEIGG